MFVSGAVIIADAQVMDILHGNVTHEQVVELFGLGDMHSNQQLTVRQPCLVCNRTDVG